MLECRECARAFRNWQWKTYRSLKCSNQLKKSCRGILPDERLFYLELCFQRHAFKTFYYGDGNACEIHQHLRKSLFNPLRPLPLFAQLHVWVLFVFALICVHAASGVSWLAFVCARGDSALSARLKETELSANDIWQRPSVMVMWYSLGRQRSSA